MQSKKSFFNGTIFKKNFTHYWPVWLLAALYLLCIVPLELFRNIDAAEAYAGAEELLSARTDAYFSVLQNIVSPILAFVLGTVAAMAVFGYLYTTRSIQAYHSLPVRREELFLTNYLSGFLFYTLPLLLAFLLGACVCGVKGITALEYLLVWFLLMEGMTFFFYNMAVFVGMLSGRLFVLPLLMAGLNYLYIGFRAVFLSAMGIISYGLGNIYEGRTSSFLSPLPFMYSKVGLVSSWQNENTVYSVTGWKYVVIYVVIAVVLGILAFLLYRKRRTEATGDMFTVSALTPVFRWGAACGGSLVLSLFVCGILSTRSAGAQFVQLLICVLLGGILCFFVAEMLLQRGFKVFNKKRFIECGIYSALMVVLLLCMEHNVFGMETKLPAEDEIANVQVQMYYPLYTEDAKGIEEVLRIHRQIIESKDEFESYYAEGKEDDGRTCYVEFYYILKDGTPFVRNYQIPVAEEYLKQQDSVVSGMRALSCDVDNYLKGTFCTNYKEAEIREVSFEVYDGETLNSTAEMLEEQDWETLYTALKQDIKEGNILRDLSDVYNDDTDYYYLNGITVSMYCKSGLRNAWTLRYNDDYMPQEDIYYITFNRSCVHTVEALERIGIVNDTDKRLFTEKELSDLQEARDESRSQ